MSETPSLSFTAFQGAARLAAGSLAEVSAAVRAAHARGVLDGILVFNDETGDQVEIDARPVSVEKPRLEERGRGRPRLGVIGREVTLLPRHWEWLAEQPGGASVALRRLVDEARKANIDTDMERKGREACYRFMSVLAGNLPGFEEAIRGLFVGNGEAVAAAIASWPADVRTYAARLATGTESFSSLAALEK